VVLRPRTPFRTLEADQKNPLRFGATLAAMKRDNWLYGISLIWLALLIVGVHYAIWAMR
jgi:hypothetical protein